jgi:hypothetical protein
MKFTVQWPLPVPAVMVHKSPDPATETMSLVVQWLSRTAKWLCLGPLVLTVADVFEAVSLTAQGRTETPLSGGHFILCAIGAPAG